MSANKRPSTSSLRRYLTSRPYVAVGDIRRRFGLDPDGMSVIARNGTTAFIGLPEREALKLQDLWQRDEVGIEMSVEVHAPVAVGVYPLRIARFVLDQVTNGHAAPGPAGAEPQPSTSHDHHDRNGSRPPDADPHPPTHVEEAAPGG